MKLDEHLSLAPRPDMTVVEGETIQPRCDLGPEELSEIEQSIVADVRAAHGETVAVAWISPSHPFSDFIRTHEVSYFPEAADVDPEYDQDQIYMAVVDARAGSGRVVLGASIMRPHVDEDDLFSAKQLKTGKTGVYTIDSLIERGNFTAQDFVDYYHERGIVLAKSLSVETNFKVHKEFEPYMGLDSPADLAYLTIFNTLYENGAEPGNAVVLATINDKQIHSLQRVGLDIEHLMGRTDFKTEEAEMGGESLPVTIRYDEAAEAIFKAMGDVVLPELVY